MQMLGSLISDFFWGVNHKTSHLLGYFCNMELLASLYVDIHPELARYIFYILIVSMTMLLWTCFELSTKDTHTPTQAQVQACTRKKNMLMQRAQENGL